MMKETKQGIYIYGEKSYEFTFETNLSISEKAKFVNSVVSLVVNREDYNPVIRDLIFDFYTIEFFTYIDTTELRQSDNFLDDVEDFLLETNVVEIVKANAFPTLFDELNKAVDKSIEYKTGIHPSPVADALSSLFSTLEKKVNEFDMNSAMEMAQKFAGITGDLTVDNVVNAYIKSDVHKKNLDEIAKSKKGKKNKKNEVKISEGLGEAVRAIIEENKAEKTEVVE